jgi:hypothetical protein
VTKNINLLLSFLLISFEKIIGFDFINNKNCPRQNKEIETEKYSLCKNEIKKYKKDNLYSSFEK